MCQRIDPAQKKYTVCSSCVFFVTANVKISNISYIIISNHVILEKKQGTGSISLVGVNNMQAEARLAALASLTRHLACRVVRW
jgi:hypothetical protein